MALGSVLLLSLAVAASAVGNDQLGPLLLWSNQGLVGQGSGSQLMYKVLDDVEGATSHAISGLFGKHNVASELLKTGDAASAQQQPSIIVFSGSQLSSADLRKGTASRLNTVLDSAASSLVLPYASGKPAAGSLSLAYENAGLSVKAIGCTEASDDLARDIVAALGQAQVIIVCPTLSEAESSLDQELDQLMAVQEAVDATEVPHVFIYTSQKESGAQRRVLASKTPLVGFGKYTECGQLCQTQVRWLEGMLALLFMSLTACAGMTCLNVLNTPTRFEASKENM